MTAETRGLFSVNGTENEREGGLEHRNQGLKIALLGQKDKKFCKQFHRLDNILQKQCKYLECLRQIFREWCDWYTHKTQ